MIDKFLLSFLGKYRERYGELIFQVCPHCGNRNWNFQTNLDKDVMHAWCCGYSGKVTKLLKDNGIKVDTTPWQSTAKKKVSSNSVVDFSNFEPIKFNQFKKFLEGRGLDERDAVKYNFMTSTSSRKDLQRYKDKIIVPLYEGSVPVYFVARDPKEKGRYYQPDNVAKNSLLFYYLGDKHRLRLYIVEGPFDGIVLNKLGYSVCMLTTSHISEEQIEKIKKFGFEEVVVTLDGDIPKVAVEVHDKLQKSGIKTKIIIFSDDADPNDLYILDQDYLRKILENPKELEFKNRVGVMLNAKN